MASCWRRPTPRAPARGRTPAAERERRVGVHALRGRLHAPAFADLLVRSPDDWRVLPHGGTGVVQVLSCLPASYPGHSLLTEDLGTVLGEDVCPCGRMGRHFRIHGRVPQAELRGCSDTPGPPP